MKKRAKLVIAEIAGLDSHGRSESEGCGTLFEGLDVASCPSGQERGGNRRAGDDELCFGRARPESREGVEQRFDPFIGPEVSEKDESKWSVRWLFRQGACAVRAWCSRRTAVEEWGKKKRFDARIRKNSNGLLV